MSSIRSATAAYYADEHDSNVALFGKLIPQRTEALAVGRAVLSRFMKTITVSNKETLAKKAAMAKEKKQADAAKIAESAVAGDKAPSAMAMSIDDDDDEVVEINAPVRAPPCRAWLPA